MKHTSPNVCRIVDILEQAKKQMMVQDKEIYKSIELKNAISNVLFRFGISAWVVTRYDMIHGSGTTTLIVCCLEQTTVLFVDKQENKVHCFVSFLTTEQLHAYGEAPCKMLQRYIGRLYPSYTINTHKLSCNCLCVPNVEPWVLTIWFVTIMYHASKDSVNALSDVNKLLLTESQDVSFISSLNAICCEVNKTYKERLQTRVSTRLNIQRRSCVEKTHLKENTVSIQVQLSDVCKQYMQWCYDALVRNEKERSETLYLHMVNNTHLSSLRKQIKLSWRMCVDNIQRSYRTLEYSLRLQKYDQKELHDAVRLINVHMGTHYRYMLHIISTLQKNTDASATHPPLSTLFLTLLGDSHEGYQGVLKILGVLIDHMRDILALSNAALNQIARDCS